jgi:hypothetical protein
MLRSSTLVSSVFCCHFSGRSLVTNRSSPPSRHPQDRTFRPFKYAFRWIRLDIAWSAASCVSSRIRTSDDLWLQKTRRSGSGARAKRMCSAKLHRDTRFVRSLVTDVHDRPSKDLWSEHTRWLCDLLPGRTNTVHMFLYIDHTPVWACRAPSVLFGLTRTKRHRQSPPPPLPAHPPPPPPPPV